jgi:scyllo-inositol 2-dehydrogenase (NADP+)
VNERVSVFGLIGARRHEYQRVAGALDSRRFEFESGVVTVTDRQVVIAATDDAIAASDASALRDYVRGGGGLVLLHGTLAAWSSSEAIRDMAGWVPTGPGPLTELVVRLDATHPVTQRLEAEWKVRDELYLSEGPPLDGSVLLRASWHFTDQAVAYERRFGDGRFVYLGIGHDPLTYDDANFQKLLSRLVLFAAGREASAPVGVGLLGYGAIAREHAAAITAMPGLRLAGVCDVSPERRAAAERDWSVSARARQSDLLDDQDVGLVVVGTPPSVHADAVLAALEAGKHVVCEKPFTLRSEDADRMIDAAARRGLALTVYQSRRWDPDYLAMREVLRSGRIGEPFYMESFVGGYSHPCDFWHSHEPISGGTIYDWGSHYFDWILQLFADRVVSVSAQAHKLVWHDVTNADQVRVDINFAGGAQATFLQSDIAAVRKPKWYVLATRGAVVGDWADVPVPADLPARVTVFRPADQGSHEERLSLANRDHGGFYRNVADHLAWGEALAVTAEEARRNVAVMEAATESIARGGVQLKVDI